MAYQQITRAQLRARVQEQLGAAATTFWRNDELNRIIQEALRVFNACTGFWKTRLLLNTTLTGGIPDVWYVIDGTITSSMRVAFNGIPLTPSTIADLDAGRKSWESETTASGGDVPTTPTLWGIGGLNLISIWPADAVGGNSLTIDGVAATPQFVNDASFADIGTEELNAILDYCQHIATFKEGGAEFEATIPLMQSFLKNAGIRNSMLMTSAKFRGWMGVDARTSKHPERVGAR